VHAKNSVAFKPVLAQQITTTSMGTTMYVYLHKQIALLTAVNCNDKIQNYDVHKSKTQKWKKVPHCDSLADATAYVNLL